MVKVVSPSVVAVVLCIIVVSCGVVSGDPVTIDDAVGSGVVTGTVDVSKVACPTVVAFVIMIGSVVPGVVDAVLIEVDAGSVTVDGSIIIVVVYELDVVPSGVVTSVVTSTLLVSATCVLVGTSAVTDIFDSTVVVLPSVEPIELASVLPVATGPSVDSIFSDVPTDVMVALTTSVVGCAEVTFIVDGPVVSVAGIVVRSTGVVDAVFSVVEPASVGATVDSAPSVVMYPVDLVGSVIVTSSCGVVVLPPVACPSVVTASSVGPV